MLNTVNTGWLPSFFWEGWRTSSFDGLWNFTCVDFQASMRKTWRVTRRRSERCRRHYWASLVPTPFWLATAWRQTSVPWRWLLKAFSSWMFLFVGISDYIKWEVSNFQLFQHFNLATSPLRAFIFVILHILFCIMFSHINLNSMFSVIIIVIMIILASITECTGCGQGKFQHVMKRDKLKLSVFAKYWIRLAVFTQFLMWL